MAAKKFSHVLPGEHVYDGVLFFEYTPSDVLDDVKNFSVRNDDVFIVTYPKAGTTWLQEIAWLVMRDGNLDAAKNSQVYMRSPFLEFKDTTEGLNEVGLEIAAAIEPPRVIKTHLPVRLAPQQLWTTKAKKLVLFRNPKDLCVSYFHFYRSSSSFGNYSGTWDEFVEMFMDGHVDHGSWYDFTKSWWQKRNDPDLLILFYEDMKQDLAASITEISEFLGKKLSQSVINHLADHCSFESMRKNPMTNHEDVYSINKNISPLLRKGTVGDWKQHFTPNQLSKFNQVYKERLGDLNIPFRYELPVTVRIHRANWGYVRHLSFGDKPRARWAKTISMFNPNHVNDRKVIRFRAGRMKYRHHVVYERE